MEAYHSISKFKKLLRIGLVKPEAESDWRWTDGHPFTLEDMWEDDEPKPGHLDAVIRSASKKFRSDQLSSWHASICQRYLGPGKFQKIPCFEYDTLELKILMKVASIIVAMFSNF